MNAEVFAQHIRCVHLLQGPHFKAKETASASISFSRARPLPHQGFHPLDLILGCRDQKAIYGDNIWMLNSGCIYAPNPQGLGEPQRAQNPLLGGAGIKEGIKRAPPWSLHSILLCLLSSRRRTHLIIIEQSNQAGTNSPPSITHQIKVLLILRSWDAYEAGLLVHKAESSERLLAGMPRESKLLYV